MKKLNLTKLAIALLATSILFTSCQEDEFYEKEQIETYLDRWKNQTPPRVSTIGTVTILIALGDLAEDQLVVTEESSRALAQSVVAFASPVENPKILVVKDFNHQGESPYDTEYIREVLLYNYQTEFLAEPEEGLTLADLEGYDLIWFNNPGHPMGNLATKDLLKDFEGGLVLSGDDLAHGSGFTTQDLTGLEYIDNGTQVECDGELVSYDNNLGRQYKVVLDESFIPGLEAEMLTFIYGNDIDNTRLIEGDYEVLASAYDSEDECGVDRPAIVRYER